MTKLSEVSAVHSLADLAKVPMALQAQCALNAQRRASEKHLFPRASWALRAPLVRTASSPCPC